MTEGICAGGLGAVDTKISRSTQGVTLEVDVKRPREPGETFEEAAAASARLAIQAYQDAVARMAAIGLTPGKDGR